MTPEQWQQLHIDDIIWVIRYFESDPLEIEVQSLVVELQQRNIYVPREVVEECLTFMINLFSYVMQKEVQA